MSEPQINLADFPEGTRLVDRELSIIRHPHFSCGRACVRGWIGCIFIARRHSSGETVEELAYDYNLPQQRILNAIAYIKKRELASGGNRQEPQK